MGMQIVMVSGSRNREGRTARSITAIANGAAKAGAQLEYIFLPELNIERCRQCDPDGSGVCMREHRCIIEDDFASIVEKLNAADAVVVASPVYFLDLCESLRAFMERLRRVKGPPKPLPGGVPRAARPGSVPAVGLCLAGSGGGGAVTCCQILEKLMLECGFDVVDMIPVRRQNLEFKLPLLELTGEWLASKPASGPSNHA
jgi:multimeric flavodoxin WrbA